MIPSILHVLNIVCPMVSIVDLIFQRKAAQKVNTPIST